VPGTGGNRGISTPDFIIGATDADVSVLAWVQHRGVFPWASRPKKFCLAAPAATGSISAIIALSLFLMALAITPATRRAW
jgi:hypothetical protein